MHVCCFDRQQNAVLQVNSALLQLTAFTAKELTGAHIESLLPELALTKVVLGEEVRHTSTAECVTRCG
jgi:hypothetical protein